MQFNYHTLKRLSSELKPLLTNATWKEAFSQKKDELIIVLTTSGGLPFFIRCTLTNDFNCLSFPQGFQKSKRNVISLFSGLEGKTVKHLEQYENERAFSLAFEGGDLFLFKLFGSRSNLILFQPSKSPVLFKKKLIVDEKMIIDSLHRPIERGLDQFIDNSDLNYFYPTFGKILKKHLYENDYERSTTKEKWWQVSKLETSLDTNEFLLLETPNKPVLSLVPLKGVLATSLGTTAIEALNKYYHHYVKVYFLEEGKRKAISNLSSKIKKNENYISKTRSKLVTLANETPPNQLADIIMANLHVFKDGIKMASLLNFYTGQSMEVKIKKNLSPQKHAESLYRKSKNRRIEVEKLEQNIGNKTTELAALKYLVEQLSSASTLKDLRKLSKSDSHTAQRPEESKPYKEFEFKEWKIWVGRNAKSNDELTLKFTFKEDIWLHVKDIPGSHVVIKYRSEKPFSQQIIEKGAQIAAYYSKRKSDSHVPVIYTPAKYVRKRKGSPAGQVIVEREQVMLVTPALGFED